MADRHGPCTKLHWGYRCTHEGPDRAALDAIGNRIGYGRAQQILGELWEQRHDCAPRGRMGVTIKDSDGVPVTAERCDWMQDGEADGTWFTGCGNAFNLEAGTPAENKMKFCCYCGKPTGPDGAPATKGGSDA